MKKRRLTRREATLIAKNNFFLKDIDDESLLITQVEEYMNEYYEDWEDEINQLEEMM